MRKHTQGARYRDRQAVDAEHTARASELEQRLREILRTRVLVDRVDETWRAEVADITTSVHFWPAEMAPEISALIQAGQRGRELGLRAEDLLRRQLEILAEVDGGGLQDDVNVDSRLVDLVKPLPRGASPREALLTWRRRLAEVKALVRRGQLEPKAAVEYRQRDAIVSCRQTWANRLPTAAIILGQTEELDHTRIAKALHEALDEGLHELRRGARR
jgi:hypothetical protein